jgi:hypothetical protein
MVDRGACTRILNGGSSECQVDFFSPSRVGRKEGRRKGEKDGKKTTKQKDR